MKTKALILASIVGGFFFSFGQAEYDDVYFSKKDRVSEAPRMMEPTVSSPAANTLKVLNQNTSVSRSFTAVNATDSYSGRTINPDYQPGGASVVSASYFTPNYQPLGVNAGLVQNSVYSSNDWNRAGNGFHPYNSYGNNFGGGYYSPYNSGFGYPTYGYSGYNSGFGMNSGLYGNNSYAAFGNPYCQSMYGSGFGYGMGNGFGGGLFNNWLGGGYSNYGGGTVVVINNPDTHINNVYGKRQSRSTNYASNLISQSGRGTQVSNGTQPHEGRGGRVASSSNSTSNTYYQRGWRQDPSITPSQSTSASSSRTSIINGGTSGGGRSSGWNNSGGGWSRGSSSSFNNDSFGGGSGSRGSSSSMGGSSFDGGGGRSSGGGTSGGTSGGGTSGGSRGRN